jgi:hypothetical protein
MKPIDFRNATFAGLQEEISAMRQSVWDAWIRFGPGTTRQVSQQCGIDILSFRPRSTELFQLGVLELVEHPGHLVNVDAHEGVYRARSVSEWEAWFNAHRDREVSGQIQMF